MSSLTLRAIAVRPTALLVAAFHAALVFGLLTALNQGLPTLKYDDIQLVIPPDVPKRDPTPTRIDHRPLLDPITPPIVDPPKLNFDDTSTDASINDAISDIDHGPMTLPTSPAWVRADIRNRTEIEYPHISKYLDEQGVVTLSVRIGVDGRPLEILISVTSGHSRLDQAALAAVAHWKFRPVTRDGVPIEAWTKLPIAFRLQD
jgi:protein TonB